MLSIVIPTYTANSNLESMAVDAVKSYKKYGEIVVVEDGQLYSPVLMELADTYIYNRENVGFTKNVNRGWRYVTGDFVAIASSDTHLVEGDLNDLCIDGKVTSPEVVNQLHITGLAGSFFVVPRSVTKERGYLVETMRTYYSDEEYANRTKDIFEKVSTVKIYHHTAQSVSTSGKEQIDSRVDKEAYENLSK